jgi:hypothetical protein
MAVSTRPPANRFVAAARKVYNPIGFSKGYNFVLWFIFGGALLGFALARLEYLDFYGTFCTPSHGVDNSAAPGECFYWLQDFYALGMIIHLSGVLPASILAFVQFIPVVRHRALLIHRINGYAVIILSLVGIAGGLMILRRTFGGGLDVQTAGGVLSIGFFVALTLAYINVKRLQIEQHRAWMLRAWGWVSGLLSYR